MGVKGEGGERDGPRAEWAGREAGGQVGGRASEVAGAGKREEGGWEGDGIQHTV